MKPAKSLRPNKAKTPKSINTQKNIAAARRWGSPKARIISGGRTESNGSKH